MLLGKTARGGGIGKGGRPLCNFKQRPTAGNWLSHIEKFWRLPGSRSVLSQVAPCNCQSLVLGYSQGRCKAALAAGAKPFREKQVLADRSKTHQEPVGPKKVERLNLTWGTMVYYVLFFSSARLCMFIY